MSLLKKLIIILVIPAVIFSCKTAEVKTNADGGRVYKDQPKDITEKEVIDGYILDNKTGRGIEGARVEIKNANMGVGYYLLRTDGNGYFKVDDFIPYVSYVMEVSADGYVSYRSTGAITGKGNKIRLNPEAVLAGTVKDSAGNGLDGVQVRLSSSVYYYNSSARPEIVETDNKGRYEFKKLNYGSYAVAFSKAGYINETAGLKYIKAGETFRLPMILTRPTSVSGKVIIEGIDAPAENITITARGALTYSASTFQDGTYRIEDLKPGSYKITVYHEGFYSIETGVMEVKEGVDRTGMDFTVKPKEPKVSVYSYRYTFAPGNKIEFSLRAFRLESVDAAVYSVPVGLLMKGGVDPDTIDPEKEMLKSVVTWKEGVKDFTPYQWRYQTLQIKDPLPTGGYCVEVKGAGGVLSRKFFTVTSAGVVLKRSRDSVFAYVTNLVDNTPVANADIALNDTTPGKKKNTSYS